VRILGGALPLVSSNSRIIQLATAMSASMTATGSIQADASRQSSATHWRCPPAGKPDASLCNSNGKNSSRNGAGQR
jgi:hypothetical protein